MREMEAVLQGARPCSHYVELFEANRIGTDIFCQLTEFDLRELGIPLGDRKRIANLVRLTLIGGTAAAKGRANRNCW